jgi:hypothetical protein
MKKYGLITVGILIALLAAGIFAANTVLAQDDTPENPAESSERIGPFARGVRCFCWRAHDPVALKAAAQALNIDVEDLVAKFKEGMTLPEIAEEAGVELQTVKDAVDAAQTEAIRTRIEQALEDGKITQEHADWLLEGLEQGFLNGRGLRFGFGRYRPPAMDEPATP